MNFKEFVFDKATTINNGNQWTKRVYILMLMLLPITYFTLNSYFYEKRKLEILQSTTLNKAFH